MEVEKSNKWVAGSGTTALGIIGTALGGFATLASGGSMLGVGGNGVNAGGNQMARENADLRAQVARLSSEKYTDSHVLALGRELSAVDANLHAVDDKLANAITQNKADIVMNREISSKDLQIAQLQAKNDMLGMESRVNSRIDAVANAANAGISANAGAIACLQNTVAGITKTVVPQSAVCNTSCSGCCCGSAQQ